MRSLFFALFVAVALFSCSTEQVVPEPQKPQHSSARVTGGYIAGATFRTDPATGQYQFELHAGMPDYGNYEIVAQYMFDCDIPDSFAWQGQWRNWSTEASPAVQNGWPGVKVFVKSVASSWYHSTVMTVYGHARFKIRPVGTTEWSDWTYTIDDINNQQGP